MRINLQMMLKFYLLAKTKKRAIQNTCFQVTLIIFTVADKDTCFLNNLYSFPNRQNIPFKYVF